MIRVLHFVLHVSIPQKIHGTWKLLGVGEATPQHGLACKELAGCLNEGQKRPPR